MKHFVRSTLVTLTLFSVPTFASPTNKPTPEAEASEEKISVRAGNSKTLNAPGVTRLALGDPEIADVKVTGGDFIRIDGLKAGETMLLVWTGKARKAYRIVVQ
jgi:Flp pilus assembly secretin CpaC